jgi:predicted TIM-barrel fold metal-dependent hydrolase
MPSFDVHQHLWPPAVVAALRGRSEPPCLQGEVLELREGSFPVELRDHELEERLELLDRDGIDVSVVSFPPTMEWESHPELRDAYHESISAVVAAAGGRVRAFAAGGCLEGFAGACVSASAVVAGLGSLPEELERAGQVLFVHPGPPEAPPESAPAWWASVTDYTSQMQAAYLAWLTRGAARHPRLPVIFAILAGGGPIQLERLRSRGVNAPDSMASRIYLDVASYGRRALELCVATVGSERLVYGSDRPVLDAVPTLRALGELGGDVRETVTTANPTSLFA